MSQGSPHTPAAPHSDLLDQQTARELLARARAAREHAYAPYSAFAVGAALLSRDGRTFAGVNVENASYGLTMCAERGAVSAAVASGVRDLVAVAIAGPDDDVPCPPCGSCRQVLHELNPELLVVTSEASGEPRVTALSTLLPEAFGGGTLRARTSP